MVFKRSYIEIIFYNTEFWWGAFFSLFKKFWNSLSLTVSDESKLDLYLVSELWAPPAG